MSIKDGIKEIITSRGVVISTKKFPIPAMDNGNKDFLITTITLQENDTAGRFICNCLNLSIDGYGFNPENAEKNMLENVRIFFKINFEKLSNEDAWDNIIELHNDDTCNELWDAYYKFNERCKIMTLPTLIENLLKPLAILKKEAEASIGFFQAVSKMRKLQKSCIGQPVKGLKDTEKQVDDFLAKRMVVEVHQNLTHGCLNERQYEQLMDGIKDTPKTSYKCAECGNEIITIVVRHPLGDSEPEYEKHCDKCGCKDFYTTTGGDMVMEGE